MKKSLSLILSLVMLFSVFAIGNTNAYAATTIKSNKDYTVTFNENTSKKTFKYKVPTGSDCFYVKVTAIRNGMARCTAKAHNKDFVLCDLDGGVNKFGGYTYAKGTMITIKLEESAGLWDGDYTKYKIRIIRTKPKNFEKESNNTKKKANKLKLKVTKSGYIFDGDNNDFWVFKAPKTGKYKISVVCASEEGRVDAYAYKGDKRVNSVLAYAGDGYQRVFTGKVKKGKKIHIKLSYEIGSLYGPMKYKIIVKKA